ncbi:hypothetical protein RIF23_07620 [Lipingzhangella sp. LS1_29]|uniref:TPR repeat domain-containing protein n=1 Tax=Lipingzhangella rawalii TaxID=2055835 RepID=A0ABU2H4D7_9ACTN|nr:hypothetical protein [Lipingzhangella rawalii]MDS1270160.1 hypothetical protein [Lipingzhangella rawalii]
MALEILGDTSETMHEFDAAATNFTDPIQWPISDRSSMTERRWLDAAASLTYCWGVTQKWIEAVEEFKDQRKKIIREWEKAVEEAISAKEGVINRAGTPAGTPPESREDGKEAGRRRLLESREILKDRDTENEEYLKSEADTLGEMLEKGVSEDRFVELLDNGGLQWAPHNILGPEGAPVPENNIDPADAEEHAEQLDEYLGEDGSEPDSHYWETIALLAALGNPNRQGSPDRSGGHSNAADYLENFYSRLEELSNEQSLPEYIVANEALDDDAKQPLANGLLALSDESMDGGFDRLPQSVRNVAIGPWEGSESLSGGDGDPYNSYQWELDFNHLGNLLSSASQQQTGGDQFSVYVTSIIGSYLDGYTLSEDGQSPSHGEIDDYAIESLLDVSTRNIDANHSVITENGIYSHPHRSDPSEILEGLWKHDWTSSQEEIVKQLTDWIPDYANSGDPGKENVAGTSAASIVDLLSDHDGLGSNLRMVRQDDGSGEGFAEFNPVIAGDISRIYYAYIDDFAIEQSLHGGEDAYSPSYVGDMDGGGGLRVSLQDGTSFLQVFMANEDISRNIFTASAEKEMLLIEEGMTANSSDHARIVGEQAGKIQSIVQNSFVNEMNARNMDQSYIETQSIDRIRSAYQGIGIGLSAIPGLVPGVGPLAGTVSGVGVSAITAATEDPLINIVEHQEWHDQMDVDDISDNVDSLISDIEDAADNFGDPDDPDTGLIESNSQISRAALNRRIDSALYGAPDLDANEDLRGEFILGYLTGYNHGGTESDTPTEENSMDS